MATMTVDQRTDMQLDLGIGPDQAVFSDYEIDRAFTRGDSDPVATLAYLYRQMISNPQKLTAYFGDKLSEKERMSLLDNMHARMIQLEKSARVTNPPLIATASYLQRDYGTLYEDANGIVSEEDD